MKLPAAVLGHVMPALGQDAAAIYAPLLEAAMAEFGISSPQRAAAFLAQAAHESGQLSRLVENLNYSAQGLIVTWPGRFGHGPDASLQDRAAGEQLAASIARQPERIANHVYAGRGGNGPGPSGDGWRYRGRGIFQLTFRDNYRNAAAKLRLPLEANPDLVATPEVGCRTAGLYWAENGLSGLADAGDFLTITRRINGGTNGLEDRKAFHARARAALGLG